MNRSAEHPIVTAARFIAKHLEWLRHQRDASQTFDEIRDAVRALRRVVDRPADATWLGVCTAPAVEDADGPADGCEGESEQMCGADLWGSREADTVRCRTCRAVYDAAELVDWLLGQAVDVLGHAELIARALSSYGKDLTPATVRGYARHGRISAHGVNAAGDPTYRLGDVLDVWTDIKEREATREAKRLAKATSSEGDSAA